MRKIIAGVLVLTAILITQQLFAADHIDLWESFPDTQGQNSFWALGLSWNNTGEGSYRWMDDLGPYRFGTLNETVGNVPFIFRGDDPWIMMYPASNGGENGTGLYYENPIYTYKVPANGTVDVSGTFQKAGTGDTYVFVKHNREFLWNHTFTLADVNGTQANFALSNIQLTEGDEIYYGVGAGGSKKNIGDLTYLSGKINAVPEPVSCVLFLLGGGALLGVRRFGKKQS